MAREVCLGAWGMLAKRPTWKSSIRRVCGDIVFTIRELEGVAIQVALFVLALYGLWTILSRHR
jgi:hypothetical protein